MSVAPVTIDPMGVSLSRSQPGSLSALLTKTVRFWLPRLLPFRNDQLLIAVIGLTLPRSILYAPSAVPLENTGPKLAASLPSVSDSTGWLPVFLLVVILYREAFGGVRFLKPSGDLADSIIMTVDGKIETSDGCWFRSTFSANAAGLSADFRIA